MSAPASRRLTGRQAKDLRRTRDFLRADVNTLSERLRQVSGPSDVMRNLNLDLVNLRGSMSGLERALGRALGESDSARATAQAGLRS